LPGHEDCDLVQDLRDAAAAVLDPVHATVVTETDSRANPRVEIEIPQVYLRPKGLLFADM